jgi:hypothetical protein
MSMFVSSLIVGWRRRGTGKIVEIPPLYSDIK